MTPITTMVNPLHPYGDSGTPPWATNMPTFAPNAFGSKPGGTDPQGAQDTSIAGNLANVNQIASLASGIGAASGAGGAANLEAALPGSGAALQSTLNLGLGEEAGQIPQSTINLIQQQAAERGVATGSPGSPDANSAYLQALGLNAENLEHQGVQDVATAVGQAPTGPQFNPQGQLLSPETQISTQQQNALNAAAPDPTAAARANQAAVMAGLGAGGVAPPSGGRLPPSQTASAAGLGMNPSAQGGGGWGNPANPFPNNSAFQLPTGNAQGGGAGGWISNGDGTSYNAATGEMRDDYTGEIIGGTQGSPEYPTAEDGGDEDIESGD